MILALLLFLQSAPVTVTLADRMADHALWLGLTGSADLYTTGWALDRCPTCYEGNQAGFNVESRIALKTAGTIGILGVCWGLEKGNHHKTALILRWTYVAIGFVAIGNNTYHALKRE